MLKVFCGSRKLAPSVGIAAHFLGHKCTFSSHAETLGEKTSLIEYFDRTPLCTPLISSDPNVGLCNKAWIKRPEDLVRKAYHAIEQGNDIVKEIIEHEPWQLRLLIRRFDGLSESLCEVADTAEFLRHVHPDEAYRHYADKASQMIASFMQVLNTHTGLYRTLEKYASSRRSYEELNQEEKAVCKSFMEDFEMSGIDMCSEDRKELVRIQERIQRIGWRLTQLSDWRSREGELEQGNYDLFENCPHLLDQEISRSKMKIHMNRPHSIRALLRSSHDPKLREWAYRRLYMPSKERLDLLTDLLVSRRDLAIHLGHQSYGELFLHDKLAKTPERVKLFLDQLSDKIMPSALIEYDILRAKYYELYGREPSKIAPWDKFFLMNEVRNDILKGDGNQIREYFSLGHCVDGLNRIFEKAFGVQLRPSDCSLNEIWSSGVRKLELWKLEDGHNDQAKQTELLGIIYMDLFSRENKYLNAAHFTLRCGRTPNPDRRQHAIATVVCNFDSPRAKNEACLLAYSDVETLFHEMGHALHCKQTLIVCVDQKYFPFPILCSHSWANRIP